MWFSRYSMMALLSSATLLKVPRRIRFRVISAKNRSTMLSQEALCAEVAKLTDDLKEIAGPATLKLLDAMAEYRESEIEDR